MTDTPYQIFVFFAKLPVALDLKLNIWFWLLIGAAPGLVFLVGVDRSWPSHMARVVAAIAVTYILLNLALHAKRHFDWNDFHTCQENSVHPDMSREMHQECSHHVNTADGASNAFALLFGWVPAAAYVGFWEGLWRLRNRTRIKEMDACYKGRRISNVTMSLIFLPIIFYFAFGPIVRFFHLL